MDRTPVFRWLSAGPLAPAWDLRLCGWQRGRGGNAVLLVPQALALRRIESLGSLAPCLRRRVVALGIASSALRGQLLHLGLGDALPEGANLIELAARALRVLALRDAQPRLRQVGAAVLDLVARDASAHGRNAGLHPREFALLWRLAELPGQTVPMALLWDELWRRTYDPETNSFHVHVSRLRAKLRRIGLPDLIETVPGGGYRLAVAPVPSFPAQGYLQWSYQHDSDREWIHEA